MREADESYRSSPVWCWRILLAAAAVTWFGLWSLAGLGAAVAAEGKAASLVSFAGADTPEDENADAAKARNYLVVPVTTRVQELMTPGENTVVCVLINQNALLGEKPSPDALDSQRLCNELAAWARRKRGSVHLLALCWDPRRYGLVKEGKFAWYGAVPDPKFDKAMKRNLADRLLWCTLEGVGTIAGFHDVYVDFRRYYLPDLKGRSHRSHPRSWGELVAALKQDMDATAAGVEFDESSTGDELVKAYPIHTQLSALLCGSEDCLVHIVPPRAEIELQQAERIPDRIERSVSELKLKKRGELMIAFTEYRYSRWAYHPGSTGLALRPPGRRGTPGKEVREQLDFLRSEAFRKRIGFARVDRSDYAQHVRRMIPPPRLQ